MINEVKRMIRHSCKQGTDKIVLYLAKRWTEQNTVRQIKLEISGRAQPAEVEVEVSEPCAIDSFVAGFYLAKKIYGNC